MSKIEKAKGFKHSKPGLWLSIGTSAFSVITVVKDVRKARGENDTLKLVNAWSVPPRWSPAPPCWCANCAGWATTTSCWADRAREVRSAPVVRTGPAPPRLLVKGTL